MKKDEVQKFSRLSSRGQWWRSATPKKAAASPILSFALPSINLPFLHRRQTDGGPISDVSDSHAEDSDCALKRKIVEKAVSYRVLRGRNPAWQRRPDRREILYKCREPPDAVSMFKS